MELGRGVRTQANEVYIQQGQKRRTAALGQQQPRPSLDQGARKSHRGRADCPEARVLLGVEKTLLIDFPICGVLTGVLLLTQAAKVRASWCQHPMSLVPQDDTELEGPDNR